MYKGMNLVRSLRATIRHNGQRTAIIDSDRSYTWADFDLRVASLASALRVLGVQPGSRFGILSRNGFRVEELKWAGFWLGAIPVPINWRLAPPEIAHILEDSNCVRVFAETMFEKAFEQAKLTPWRARVLVFGDSAGENAPVYESLIADF